MRHSIKQKDVNDHECTNQFTSVTGLIKFSSENPDKFCDTWKLLEQQIQAGNVTVSFHDGTFVI